jgi:CysZ protein
MSRFLAGAGRGIAAYGRAFSLLFSRGFWWFLLFPVPLACLLFLGGHLLADRGGDALAAYLEALVTGWTSRPWVAWIAGFLARGVTRVLYYHAFLLWGGYLVMAVMSPLFSWLSERVEARLSGRRYPFSARRFAWEVTRGLLVAAWSVLMQLLVFLALFVLAFVPVVGLLVPVAGFLATAYFYGFAFMDYAVERRRLTLGEGIDYIRRDAGRAVGVGGVFALSLLLPFWPLFTCPFMALLAVIAAAVALDDRDYRRHDHEDSSHA